MALADLTPSGQSQSTCKAIVGQTPVTRCTCPASLNFSSVVEAAAACKNLPKRVPVLANPQEGISIWKRFSAAATRSDGVVLFTAISPSILAHAGQVGFITIGRVRTFPHCVTREGAEGVFG